MTLSTSELALRSPLLSWQVLGQQQPRQVLVQQPPLIWHRWIETSFSKRLSMLQHHSHVLPVWPQQPPPPPP
eukprot:CAMPEP_0197849332 /NCGR_PEP_ID=MMETSP1438-20131217/11672_1 /TAXON_ID=1461541 /ORGANISM="Pterosperma sp., Strain CCMP1384" /LENGTH=71 /DNA_ID=CAMNT_0043461963 /DNA_START=31 /DNA_END=242 /DNA_ORIENTATION=-